MLESSLSHHELSVVAKVDVLVVGGTAAAVAFALSVKRSGASVYLVAPKPYLGDDICAAYRFWPEVSDVLPRGALAQEIFNAEQSPPTPMHVKLSLEQSLIRADVPFLFNCFTAGLLQSKDGQIGGAVIANRSGHQVIAARVVVDATMEGSVLAQAGHRKRHQLQGQQSVQYITLCEGAGETRDTACEVEVLPGYTHEDYQLSARRYIVSADFASGTPQACARAMSDVVEQCWVKSEFRRQSWLTPLLPPAERLPELSDLCVADGLFALTESVQLGGGAEVFFANPTLAMSLADSLAVELCAQLPDLIEAELHLESDGALPIASGQLCTLRDALRPGERSQDTLSIDFSQIPVIGAFDVVVAGGGTGGAPAAIGAARAGAKTLVVEVTSGLGGVGTMGQIATYWCGNRVGFTSEIDAGVNTLEAKAEYRESPDGWSIAAKAEWYHKTGYEAGCTYWFNTLCVGTWVVAGRVVGLVVAGPYGYGLVKAGCVVDSTGCSDIPAAAGAPTAVIGKDHIAVQGTGLAGVRPGRNYNNSDHNFSDDTDVMDTTAFFVSSKLKFKDDFDCGELVDSRERRQIIGDATVTPVDILMERRHPDTICVATSNFDSHGFTVDPTFMLVPPSKHDALWADVPLRALLPQGLDGVLVTGLGVSAHRDALPVIRMQADVQNQGYAAGLIAAHSAASGEALRALDLRVIQRELVEAGTLPPRVLTDVDSFPVTDARLVIALAEQWDSLVGVALLLSEPERSRPLIAQAYAELQGTQSEKHLRYAQLLALLGDGRGQDALIVAIHAAEWDAGWDFRGMHQFGMNMSTLDSLIVCLGSVGDDAAWPCILEKLAQVPADSEFSHFRALAMACEALYARHPNPAAAKVFYQLLQRPEYTGHTHRSVAHVQAALTADINENQIRGDALRELHLARALYLCGDSEGRGEAILQQYAADLRGHFARHAKAVLAEH